MADPTSTPPLLAIRDLAVSFAPRGGNAGPRTPRTHAVSGVSMTIYPAQTLAVVGESGSGKSVTAMSLMRLLPTPPAHIERGVAMFNSATGPLDLLSLSERDTRKVRGAQIAMIFQEPMTSLNPVLSVGDQITEAILLHRRASKREANEIAIEALRTVGIPNPAARLGDYPHQFSGGMRQRVMIAMALACRPRLLLADEPTTALDATIQKQILDLLRELQTTTGMAVMLITHDLGIVRDRADVVCVMYAGRVVEYARADELFARPLHPYTRALLACVPSLGTRRARLSTIAETAQDADFFRIPGHTLIPWWPGRSEHYALSQIAPEHWIALAPADSMPANADPPDIATSILQPLKTASPAA